MRMIDGGGVEGGRGGGGGTEARSENTLTEITVGGEGTVGGSMIGVAVGDGIVIVIWIGGGGGDGG